MPTLKENSAKKNESAKKSERVFVVPDLHVPYHDPKAVSLAKQLFDAFKPTRSIFIGDNRDFIWASRFFVPHAERQGAVVRELQALRKVAPLFTCSFTQYLRGNHEGRILEYLDKHPELEGLEGFTPQTLYPGLAQSDFIPLAEGSFIVTHGSIVRKGPGNSAAAEMQKWGRSGCSGHTHRLCRLYKRDYSGVRVWLECGHLAQNPPHYRKMNDPAPQDWQQGVVIVETQGNRFHAEEIPFTLSYKAAFRGKTYKA